MSDRVPNRFVERVLEFDWIKLPLAARRLSAALIVTLVDGLYLAVWPRVAVILSPLAFFSGLLIGWQHWGFQTVFSESIIVACLAVALGLMSGHLGALFVAGFICGDFVLYTFPHRSYSGGLFDHFWRTRIPSLIEYSLLALPVGIPIWTKALVAELTLPASLSRAFRFGVAVLAHAGISLALVYLWTQTVPVLIRPIFTWVGRNPPVAAVEPLQMGMTPLLILAVLASLGRMALQGSTAFQPGLGKRLNALHGKLNSASPVEPLWSRIHPWIKITLRTLWATLMLAGMFMSWFDALLIGGVILLLQAARHGLLPLPISGWQRLMERLPVVFRLLTAAIVFYFVATRVLPGQMASTNTFRPVLFLTIFALLILFALHPGTPRSRAREELST